MLRSQVFFVIIMFNLLHRINSFQLSDWTYDCSGTDRITLKSNGKTYSCAMWQIQVPLLHRLGNIGEPCENKSPDDPSCAQSRTMTKRERYCTDLPPTPTAEDILEKVETLYRSASPDEQAATQEWYDQVLRNLTQIENDCRENGTSIFRSTMVNTTQRLAHLALHSGRAILPVMWYYVSNAEDVLKRALEKNDGVYVRNLSATFDHEARDRDELFSRELSAMQDCSRNGFSLWHELAERRTKFVRQMSVNYKMEHVVTTAAQRFVENRMEMLVRMAVASEWLAFTQATVEDVAASLKLVCIPRDYHNNMKN